MRPTRSLAVLAAFSALLAGCGGAAPEPGSAAAKATSPTAPASSEAGGQSTPPSTSGPDHITLAFAGDIHFERQVESLLHDSPDTWRTRLPELAAADFSVANLETAITERGTRQAKSYTFRTSPRALPLLAAAGIDALSLANNHAADFGSVGVQDTLSAKAASPIPLIGFGKNATEAFAPLSVDIKGVKTAIVAATQISEETVANFSAGDSKAGVAAAVDRTRLREATRKAAADHDLVVVFLHWGTEGTTCPNESQQATVKDLEADGADIIVGTHAHRPQGSGYSGRSFVGYGLGNFIWYNTSLTSRSSGVLTVTVDAKAARARGAATGDQRRTNAPLVDGWTWAPKLISYGGVPKDPGDSTSRLQGLAKSAQACTGLASKRTD